MTDVPASRRDGDPADGEPADEELAAALAAVHLYLRGRRPGDSGSRWKRAGRMEAVTAALPVSAGWGVAERPR